MNDPVHKRINDYEGPWGTREFKWKDFQSQVSVIHFIAHTNPTDSDDNGQPPTNHWTMYLELIPVSSVHVEIAPNDYGRPSMVVLESQDTPFTDDHTYRVSITPISNTTVRRVLEAICKYNRDQYTYAPVGEGCRFWLSTVAGDFANEGLIASSDAQHLQTDIQCYYPSPRGTPGISRTISAGRFHT